MNFFNVVRIRFQNIAANDAVVASKLTAISKEGWELFTVVSGVESFAGKADKNGIFISSRPLKKAFYKGLRGIKRLHLPQILRG